MLIPHKGHTDTIQVYSVTVMTHVKALQAGHSSQGTSEPITPEREITETKILTLMILTLLQKNQSAISKHKNINDYNMFKMHAKCKQV